MTFYSACKNDALGTWARRTVVDHWLKAMLPILAVEVVLLVVAGLPLDVAVAVSVGGGTVGWVVAGIGQNIVEFIGGNNQ